MMFYESNLVYEKINLPLIISANTLFYMQNLHSKFTYFFSIFIFVQNDYLCIGLVKLVEKIFVKNYPKISVIYFGGGERRMTIWHFGFMLLVSRSENRLIINLRDTQWFRTNILGRLETTGWQVDFLTPFFDAVFLTPFFGAVFTPFFYAVFWRRFLGPMGLFYKILPPKLFFERWFLYSCKA